MWKNRLPQLRDVGCPWGMFSAVNYIQILYGLGWFDTEKIKQEYEILGKDDSIDSVLNGEDNHTFWVGHKKAIKMLIDGYYKIKN